MRQAIQTIQQAQHIAIFSHIRPDGDAYGTMLGLGLSLRQIGKNVDLFNQDGLTPLYQFLPGLELIQTPQENNPPSTDLIISVDTSTQERLGPTFQTWNKKVDINIDHHESNTLYGSTNIIRPDLPASSCIILQLIQEAGWPLTPDVATNLFTGISTDTGSFRYQGTNADTFHMASQLIQAGANPSSIAQHCYQSISLQRFQLNRLALATTQLEHDNQLAYLTLDQNMFTRTGAQPQDTEGLIERLQEIQTVKIAVVFEEMPDQKLRVSLRSKDPDIPVNQIAQQFGGGGHPLAAGIRLSGDPRQNIKKILASLHQALAR